VTELSYSSKLRNHEIYNIGGVLYSGNSVYITNRQEEAEKKKKVNYALWGSIEKTRQIYFVIELPFKKSLSIRLKRLEDTS